MLVSHLPELFVTMFCELMSQKWNIVENRGSVKTGVKLRLHSTQKHNPNSRHDGGVLCHLLNIVQVSV